MTEETKDVAGVNGERLKSIIERIERLMEEKKGIQDDIKDIFLESKAHGYSPKIIKMVLKVRKMAKEERMEQEELVDVYMNALGMV